ncbi:MFS transporter [Halostella sp. JP-L12]|uniref:MFS transporter n=1 Tax=Halostella TaxID=1843185 RepID=UPI0013CF3858|nr:MULTISPECIES: MFS transporter [Halostella]NHN47872.1 MFS transporter [Halostella sp. JP-L12]
MTADDANAGGARGTRLWWTLVIFLFVGIDGVGFQMRGALLPSLEESFRVSPGLLGLVATAGTVGFVAAVLTTGAAAGRVDVRKAMLASAALVGVCVFAMGLAPAFVAYLGALLVRGIATGPFRTLDRAALSHLYPADRAKAFNRYALVWAVGATLGPVLVSGAVALGNWRYAYFGLAFAFLPVVAILWRLELPDSVETERPLTLADVRSVLHRPAVAGMCAALVITGGIEGSLFTWLPYFAARRLDDGTASLVLSAFLLAYVPARLFYSVVVDRLRSIDLVLALGVLSLPTLYATVYLASGRWLFVAVFALGFLISGIFPTLSAFAVDAAPEFSGPINALATSASYGGIATVPALVGLYADRYDIRAALGLLLLGLVAFVGVTAATRRSTGPDPAPAAAGD